MTTGGVPDHNQSRVINMQKLSVGSFAAEAARYRSGKDFDARRRGSNTPARRCTLDDDGAGSIDCQ